MTNKLADWSHPSINCCVKTTILWEIRKSGFTPTFKPKDRLKRKENKNKVMLSRPIKQEVGNMLTGMQNSHFGALSI